MPISKAHSSLGSKNSGSCYKLANYLEKENQELESSLNKTNSLKDLANFLNRKQDFFDHTRSDVNFVEVVDSIDNNIKKLCKKDSKFFSPTINFSQQEQEHIISLITQEEVNSIWDLNHKQFEQYNHKLREYIKKVMNNYAINFNRKEKGLRSGEDLVYFAKIEHFRKFKGYDKCVKEGDYKSGDYKPGLNSHAHIIVSRKDKTQRLKLTPTTKEKSTKRKIGNNVYQVGFDRMRWTNLNEKSFDDYFKYDRPELEKFENQYILKNGSPFEKDKLKQKIKSKALEKKELKQNLSIFDRNDKEVKEIRLKK
ncbi:DUF5712 family protein [Leeuwenhoekiella aestuarii]|uniref:Mobilization protein n=1 Tax=Leeuwenhoekiella aestuarii TaxID=2249426 RepID=A0A4Q0NX47_9FLAO|nr:DUF5712 family protein [Leeuwenhoekiella aestuarii]RXG16554.1 hypothetical protein DSM04_102127 [Leeuwenhoekiella aestuarii]